MPTITSNKYFSMQMVSMPVVAMTSMLLAGQAHAGAWTGPEGNSYNKLGINYFTSDESYDGQGNTVGSTSEFTDLNLTYYGEYGFRDNISGFLSVAFKSVESDPAVGASSSTSAIGDIDVGVRYNLYNGEEGVFSVQGLLKVPEAYDENDSPPVGNGQYDVEVRLLYGKSLHPLPMYYGLEAGYRYRADAPSDELKYLAEIGYTVSEQVYLRSKLDGTTSAKNADKINVGGSNPTLGSDYDVGKLELTAGYKISSDLYFEFTWTPTVYGRSTAAGNTLGFALVLVGVGDN